MAPVDTCLRHNLALLRADFAIIRADVTIIRTDVTIIRADVTIIRADLAEIRRHLADITIDMVEVKGQLRRMEAAMEDRDRRTDAQFERLFALVGRNEQAT